MVFSAAIYSNTTTGNSPRDVPETHLGTPVDHQIAAKEAAYDKHDAFAYTVANAPLIAMGGAVAGAQEAFYKFEKMGPTETRNSFRQAGTVLRSIGRKTLWGAALGGVFCYTEATLENYRGTHDIWNGMAAGAAAGALFGLPRPMPQPLAWPLMFAATAAVADIIGEYIPLSMRTFKTYGALENRPTWNDPEPPRPPVLDTGAASRPTREGHFWRGA